MHMKEKTVEQFLDELYSNKPVPGGGGASVLVAAIGTALGGMVGNLTTGKKKYADVQPQIDEALEKAKIIQKELEELIQKDADVFEPLSKAYGLPKSTPEEIAYKEKVMEEALEKAAYVPLEIMRKTVEAIELHRDLEKIGSKLAMSDVGVGVAFCKAALEGASLNVFINTNMLKNEELKSKINKETNQLLNEGKQVAAEVFQSVFNRYK